MLTKEQIGRKIKDLRFKNNKSQKELGKHLGKSHAAVSDIERGRTELSAIDLAKIADFFDVPVESILAIDPEPAYLGTFSHHRASRGIDTESKEKLQKARAEFIKQAREQAKDD